MSDQEQILMQEAGVKAYDSESPPSFGLKAGAFADVGTLILTNRRLVYVNKGGDSRSTAWVLGGALAARAVEKSASKAELDDLMRYEGSYSIPLELVTHVESARKLGNAYLRVDGSIPGQKPSHSFIFGSGIHKNEEWVQAINSAASAARTGQSNPGAYYQAGAQQSANYPPPPPPTAAPICPFCGGPLTFIVQYQRWYCYRDQRYV
jgi:hypothetical protein